MFDERELELLIGGIADIDVDDWKKHTDYRGYTENDEVIVNFWKVITITALRYFLLNTNIYLQCVRGWDAEQKSRLLQFTTGTSRIPVNGFKDLQGSDGPRRFTIEKAGEIIQLPKSHTWWVFLIPIFDYFLFRKLTLAVSIDWIFHPTGRLRYYSKNCRWLWRKPWALVKNELALYLFVCICLL